MRDEQNTMANNKNKVLHFLGVFKCNAETVSNFDTQVILSKFPNI
jgi:hypothetical protein